MRISSERDLIELLEADIGIAVIPRSVSTPEDDQADQCRRTRTSPHRSSLWGRRARAHRGGVRGDENAARRRLVALSQSRRRFVSGLRPVLQQAVLAVLARAFQRCDQVVDFHALAEVGIEKSRLHHARRGRPRRSQGSAASSRHCRENSACPGTTTAAGFRCRARSRDSTTAHSHCRDRSEPETARLKSDLNFSVNCLQLRHDRNHLAARCRDPVMGLDHGPDIQPAIGTPVTAIKHHRDRSFLQKANPD